MASSRAPSIYCPMAPTAGTLRSQPTMMKMSSIVNLRNIGPSMATVELKGLYKVTSKGKAYWYAWRGGPRIDAEPGTEKFLRLYQQAIEERGVGDKKRFRSLVVRY